MNHVDCVALYLLVSVYLCIVSTLWIILLTSLTIWNVSYTFLLHFTHTQRGIVAMKSIAVTPNSVFEFFFFFDIVCVKKKMKKIHTQPKCLFRMVNNVYIYI